MPATGPRGMPAAHGAHPGAPLQPVLEVPNGRLFVATILHGSTIALGALLAFGLLGAGVRSVGPAGPGRHPGAAARRDRHRLQPGQGAAHPRQLPPRRRRHRRAGPGGAHRPAGHHDPAAPHPGPRARAAAVVAAGRAGGGSGSTSPGPAATGEGEGQRETTLLPVGTLDDARRVLALVAPGCPPQAWDGAVLGDGTDPRGAGRPRPPAGSTPLSWRRNGWADAPSAVLLRSRPAHPSGDRGAARAASSRSPCARAGSSPGSAWRRCTSCPPPGPVVAGAGPPRRRARRGLPRRGVRTRPVGAPQVGTTARPPCTRPSGVGGLVPAPAGHPRTRKAVSTVNTPAPPPIDPGTSGSGVVERLGFARDQVVQEFGYDSDVDDEFRYAVEDLCGAEIEDDDYTGGADAVLLWWREGDGDLGDALVDMVGVLDDGGFVVLLTPKARRRRGRPERHRRGRGHRGPAHRRNLQRRRASGVRTSSSHPGPASAGDARAAGRMAA